MTTKPRMEAYSPFREFEGVSLSQRVSGMSCGESSVPAWAGPEQIHRYDLLMLLVRSRRSLMVVARALGAISAVLVCMVALTSGVAYGETTVRALADAHGV